MLAHAHPAAKSVQNALEWQQSSSTISEKAVTNCKVNKSRVQASTHTCHPQHHRCLWRWVPRLEVEVKHTGIVGPVQGEVS